MDNKKYTEANRKAWNAVSPKHEEIKRDAKKQFFEPGFSCLDETVTEQLQAMGLPNKDVAQVCCNDGVETLSLKNLGAASATGFDISDAAIASARALAERTGIDAQFVRTDIYDMDPTYDGCFDLVYISAGVMNWFPDAAQFFDVVARLLRPGGILLIYELHPFLHMLDDEGEEAHIKYSYFESEPWVYDDGITYMGNDSYAAPTAYNFAHTISDSLHALLQNNLQIKALHEYAHSQSASFEHLDEADIRLPMSWLVRAEKS